MAPVEQKLTGLKKQSRTSETGREKIGEEESIFEKRYQEIIGKIKEEAEVANTELRKSEEKTVETRRSRCNKEKATKQQHKQ